MGSMKFRLVYAPLVFLVLTSSSFGQVIDRAPSGRQNYLAAEGGGWRVNIDTTTSLDSLLARLYKEWDFVETGKGYWIGYTNDMFSIAARGDSAIEPLLHIAKESTNEKARVGAVYSLHLIGINRTIAGRMTENFVDRNARLALLQLLKIPDLQKTIMLLLIRDPWVSDLPHIMEAMEACTADCLVLTNGLTRYQIDSLPIHQTIPDNIQNISFKLTSSKPHVSKAKAGLGGGFEATIKEVLSTIKRSGNQLIEIEDTLFKLDLTGTITNTTKNSIDVGSFLHFMDFDDNLYAARSLHYYLEGGKLYICSPMTAQKRVIYWWKDQTPEQKAFYNKNHP
jgi:hypothetical protein